MSYDPKSKDFDPYSAWLGLAPGPRPPGPEELLGVAPGETDADRILEAAMERKKRLDGFALSEHNRLASHLAGEVAHAMSVLLKRAPSAPDGLASQSEPGSKAEQFENLLSELLKPPVKRRAADGATSLPAPNLPRGAEDVVARAASHPNADSQADVGAWGQAAPAGPPRSAQKPAGAIRRRRAWPAVAVLGGLGVLVAVGIALDAGRDSAQRPDIPIPEGPASPVESKARKACGVKWLTFVNEGRTLVCQCADGQENRWDVRTGEPRDAPGEPGDSSDAPGAKVEPRPTSGPLNEKELFDLAVGDLRQYVQRRYRDLHCVVADRDRSVVATGGVTGELRLWQRTSGRLRWTAMAGNFPSLALGPDGSVLVSGSGVGDLVFWDTRSGTPRRRLRAGYFAVTFMDFAPNGVVLASGDSGGTVKLWSAMTGDPLRSLHSGTSRGRLQAHDVAITFLVFAPDGVLLASGDSGGTVRLWNTTTGAPLRSLDP